MSGDHRDHETTYEEVRLPEPLRERVDDLFVDERGYEPASFQEALSVVLDLATDTARGSRTTESKGDRRSDSPGAGDETAGSESSELADPRPADDSQSHDYGPSAAPDVVPESVSVERDADDSVSFDAYVDGLESSSEDDPAPAVESILDTEHADSVVRELAAEVLDEMTQDAFQELEHGVDEGVAGVTDGHGGTQAQSGGETAPSGTTGDGVPDSLTADPESDCAVCGRPHRVSVLQTTILDEDGSVALVCPSCAE